MIHRLTRIATKFALAVFIWASASSVVSADPLQFSWLDDQGDAGHFIWDTSQGYTTNAILEFAYILFDGSPTPPGYIPNSFTTFNNGFSWDLNTGVEGVDFTFTTAFNAPFPTTPEVYEMAFVNGNFISQSGQRLWSDITVMEVPEPCSSFAILGASFIPLIRRRRQV